MLRSTRKWLLWCDDCDHFRAKAFELRVDDVFVKSKSRVTHCSGCGARLQKREIMKEVNRNVG